MRLLLVGMLNSVHLARWVAQVADQGWEIHLYPSTEAESPHALMAGLPLVFHRVSRLDEAIERTRNRAVRFPFVLARVLLRWLRRRPDPARRLRTLIAQVRPDVLHSLETQAAGYLVERVRSSMPPGSWFPPWLHTNWGSDLYLFGRLEAHRDRVRRVLRSCDFYSCESRRDEELARAFGFSGIVAATFPNTGGFDLEGTRARAEAVPASRRSVILVKGYQGWAGRALVGIKALSLVSDLLRPFEVLVFGNPNGEDVRISAELLAIQSGARVRVLPMVGHDEMLGLFASARVYIGLSISDSISTSLLEAMCMGAYPIQSDTSTGDEWIRDGETGALVPAEEPVEIARRIRDALQNDVLVDDAARRNRAVICERADSGSLKTQAVEMYQRTRGGG